MSGNSASLEDAVVNKIDKMLPCGASCLARNWQQAKKNTHCVSDGGNEVELSATEAGAPACRFK